MGKNSNSRFREIWKVLTKYGLNYLTLSKIKKQEFPPENIRMAFEELGPTFIKIGQIISTRTDILPEKYTSELKKLQDEAAPEEFSHIEQVFFEEFGVSISNQFKSFDKVPIASASIAQVHKAVLMDGRDVIVKIQRPHIREKMQQDITILIKLLKMSKKLFKDSIINPIDALNEIWLSTQKELDFTIEMDNTIKFKELNKNVSFIYVPYVVETMSSERILTMERIDGIKIDDTERLLKEHYILSDISRKLALGFLKQVFEDGFFHADPHPGNILIKDNKICFIDFGLVGSLNESLKASLNDALMAIVLKDVNMLISVLMSLNTKKIYIDRNLLYEDVDYLFFTYLNTSFSNINISDILNDVFALAAKHKLQLPKELTMVMKSLIILEGVMTNLSPEIKIIDIAFTYAQNSKNFIPKISKESLLLKTYTVLNNLSKMPEKVIEASETLSSGRAKIQIEHKKLEKPIAELNKMVNRIVFGLVVSAIILASASLITSNAGPKINGISFMGIAGFLISGVLAIWLLISIIKSGMT